MSEPSPRAVGRGSPAVIGRWAPIVGLAAIWAVMTVLNPRFLSAVNLTNLTLQFVAVGTIAAGVVLVLLIGEIDLSVGAVSGFGAAVVAVLTTDRGWPAVLAVATGLLVGVAVGILHGLLVTRIGIPSFVVTLAGLLTWQGALLLVLGETGTIHLTDPRLLAVSGSYLTEATGWVLAGIAVVTAIVVMGRGGGGASVDGAANATAGGAVGGAVNGASGRAVGGVALARLRAGWPWLVAAAASVLAVAVFNADRGTPLVIVLFVGLLAVLDVVVRRTRFGRHVLAVGSNATAARRAGIPVMRIRVTVFALASTLAVVGGILAASRLFAVSQSSGSTDLMLAAVAAAVIGGASMFGGRGSVWAALLGALVVGSLANGLDLLGASSAVRSIATGAVLAVAVGLDTLTRRRADAPPARRSPRRPVLPPVGGARTG